MGIVEDFKKKKALEKLGLPKVFVVKSNREGVELPVERQVIEIKENASLRTYADNRKVVINQYLLDEGKFPYEAEFEVGQASCHIDGYGSGFGDLWCWTYFITFIEQDALAYYNKEAQRVTETYLNTKQL